MKKLLFLLMGLFVPLLSFSDCLYYGQHDLEMESYESCGEIKGDQIVLHNLHKKNLIFDKDGLSCVVNGGDAFYITKKGVSRRVIMIDAYCDDFEDGFARGYENGKMVYIDKKLNTILKPDFEWLSPFYYEHGVVCNGPFETINDSEHSWKTKGQCGLIDKKGKLVVDAKYPIEDHDAFYDYINNNNHCPKPPITTKKSAICHAKRHLQHQENFQKLKKIVSAKKNNDQWLVNFFYEDESQGEFVIELETKTAAWLSIVPVE